MFPQLAPLLPKLLEWFPSLVKLAGRLRPGHRPSARIEVNDPHGQGIDIRVRIGRRPPARRRRRRSPRACRPPGCRNPRRRVRLTRSIDHLEHSTPRRGEGARMSTARPLRTGRHRADRPVPDADGPPACPGCGRRLDLQQPDPNRPGEILGVCQRPACGEWVLLHLRGDRWTVLERIPPARREPRNPIWTPARPATPETAAR